MHLAVQNELSGAAWMCECRTAVHKYSARLRGDRNDNAACKRAHLREESLAVLRAPRRSCRRVHAAHRAANYANVALGAGEFLRRAELSAQKCLSAAMQDGADAVPACEAAAALRVKSKAESNRELVCELGNAGWDARCATRVASNVDLKGRRGLRLRRRARRYLRQR